MSARLIVFAGPPCSGKSDLAARTAKALAIPHVQMDETRARLMPDSAHTRHDRAIAYRAMAFAAELLLARKEMVILDAPYGHAEDRRDLADVIARTKGTLYLIECRVTADAAVERFRRRPPEHVGLMDLTEDRVRELVQAYEYTGAGLVLDTSAADVERSFGRVRAYLGTGGCLGGGQDGR